jgi:predicted dehydrogenase
MPTLTAPVRIALVGTGVFARDAHLPALLRLPHLFEIVAIYGRRAEAAAALAEQVPNPVHIYTELDALWARTDIEAVDLVLPIPVLPAMVEKALTAGKHVLSEKPIAPGCAAGEALVQLAAQRPRQVWMVGENWRYEEAFWRAGELVKQGAIGRPIACHWAICIPIDSNSKYYHTLWRRDSSFAGGFIMDTGVHHVAVLRMVLGEIAAVTATATLHNAELPPVDTVAATLHFTSGAVGSYLATFATGVPWSPQLYVAGQGGALRVQRRELELTAGGKSELISCEGFDGVYREMIAFAQAIRDGSEHRNSPLQGLQDVAVVEAMLAAAESGQRVEPRCYVS